MFNQLKPLMTKNLIRFISMNHFKLQQKMSTSKGGKLPEKLRRAQMLFQAKNNLPVFLKGGKSDKILYYTTMGLTGLGLISTLVFLASFIID